MLFFNPCRPLGSSTKNSWTILLTILPNPCKDLPFFFFSSYDYKNYSDQNARRYADTKIRTEQNEAIKAS
jgi:hypothetical protein